MSKKFNVKLSAIKIKYSPVNQSYLVLWHSQVLRVFNSKKQANDYVKGLQRKEVMAKLKIDLKAFMAKPKIYRVYAKPNMTTVTPRLAYDIPAKNALEAKKKVITISKRYYKNTNAKPKDLIAKRIK